MISQDSRKGGNVMWEGRLTSDGGETASVERNVFGNHRSKAVDDGRVCRVSEKSRQLGNAVTPDTRGVSLGTYKRR
jgi:hypothetical protein